MRGTIAARIHRQRHANLVMDRLRWAEWDNAEPIVADVVTVEQLQEIQRRWEAWNAEWELMLERLESRVSSVSGVSCASPAVVDFV